MKEKPVYGMLFAESLMKNFTGRYKQQGGALKAFFHIFILSNQLNEWNLIHDMMSIIGFQFGDIILLS